MMLVYSFLFCGIICLIGEIIFDNSKLTFGHITSMFVVVGAILSIFGIYDKIASVVGVGANLPIVSFGNSLTNGAYKGFMKDGFIGTVQRQRKAAAADFKNRKRSGCFG